MGNEKHCPLCGDDSEYSRFIDLCAKRANEIWRENEVKTMIDVYTSMDFVQVVRCKDCRHFRAGEEDEPIHWCDNFYFGTEPDGFCAWGNRVDFVTCKCGEELEAFGRVQTCPSCGRRLMA